MPAASLSGAIKEGLPEKVTLSKDVWEARENGHRAWESNGIVSRQALRPEQPCSPAALAGRADRGGQATWHQLTRARSGLRSLCVGSQWRILTKQPV